MSAQGVTTSKRRLTGMWAKARAISRWSEYLPISGRTCVCASFPSSCSCSWCHSSSTFCHNSAQPSHMIASRSKDFGQWHRSNIAVNITVSDVPQRHPRSQRHLRLRHRRPRRHLRLRLPAPRRHVHLIATLGTMSGLYSGSRDGQAPRKYSVAKQQDGDALQSCHRPLAFRRVASQVKPIRDPTIAMLGTIRAIIASSGNGRPRN